MRIKEYIQREVAQLFVDLKSMTINSDIVLINNNTVKYFDLNR